MPIGPLLARAGKFLLGRLVGAGASAARKVDDSITSALTNSQSSKAQNQTRHDPSHAIKTLTDTSFWGSLLTILMIPVLLLLALFEIVVKAAPWATGQ